MLSISRSRYNLLVQFVFLAVNGAGVLLVTIYNAPDLYPNNAHHKLGWILTWIMGAQAVMGVISAYTRRKDDRGAFIPVSTQNIEQHQRIHNMSQAQMYRFSNDSGQGTEPNTESLRSQSISSTHSDDPQLPDVRMEHEEEDQDEKLGLMHGSKVDKFLSKKIPGLVSGRLLRVFQFFYNVIDRVILILGFVAMSTGIVTYGGFFVSRLLSFKQNWILILLDWACSLQWTCTLYQRWRVLLVWYLNYWSLGRLLCGHRLGLEHHAQQGRPKNNCGVCGELPHFLLWVYERFPGAFDCVGRGMECPGSGAHFDHRYVLWWWIGNPPSPQISEKTKVD
jgi:hypothetical protein